ncbi:MAG: VOC family protein [Bryobacteraceae bacterium]|jgi:catechol 2,3-dioxygenase-like lactoylglutathione lyase family enzyme
MSIVPAKLHHVSRQTRKLDETRRFYVDVLGFRELSSRPNFPFRGAWLYGSGIQIHLIDEPYHETGGPPNPRENHIAFLIEDMDAAEQTLVAHGISYRRQQAADGRSEQIFFRDPEGWMVELGNYRLPIDV